VIVAQFIAITLLFLSYIALFLTVFNNYFFEARILDYSTCLKGSARDKKIYYMWSCSSTSVEMDKMNFPRLIVNEKQLRPRKVIPEFYSTMKWTKDGFKMLFKILINSS
jgi:hypothetical protein